MLRRERMRKVDKLKPKGVSDELLVDMLKTIEIQQVIAEETNRGYKGNMVSDNNETPVSEWDLGDYVT
jgi:hypothetical protein